MDIFKKNVEYIKSYNVEILDLKNRIEMKTLI